jgi:type II secretory pathway component GspD/PulD (secretin)
LTQLDDRLPAGDLDRRTVTLAFPQPVQILEVLIQVVRGTTLSVVPGPMVAGSFVGELKHVSIRQALTMILQPLGLDFTVDGALVRVFRPEPEVRLFDVNYIAARRAGTTTVGTSANVASGAQVTSSTSIDSFDDLSEGVRALLSEGATFSLDRKAGLLQVVDFPNRLDRVSDYLDAVHDRVQRQVRIDVRVVEVELADEHAQTIDWAPLTQSRFESASQSKTRDRSLTGLRITDVPTFLNALKRQGKVTTLADPHILALNNEPAILRGMSETATLRKERTADSAGHDGGLTLSVTPRIGADGIVMLSLNPSLSVSSEDGYGKPKARLVREASTLARVADGETIVFAGFPHSSETRKEPNAARGGWLGRKTSLPNKRTELLILLTPRILNSSAD